VLKAAEPLLERGGGFATGKHKKEMKKIQSWACSQPVF
jgi:hypothetical protein